MSKLVLKVCIGKWDSASRDKRELAACRELGLRTLVLAGGAPGDHGRPDTVDGFDVLRYATRPLGENASTKLNRGLSVLQWAHAIRKLHPDYHQRPRRRGAVHRLAVPPGSSPAASARR